MHNRIKIIMHIKFTNYMRLIMDYTVENSNIQHCDIYLQDWLQVYSVQLITAKIKKVQS